MIDNTLLDTCLIMAFVTIAATITGFSVGFVWGVWQVARQQKKRFNRSFHLIIADRTSRHRTLLSGTIYKYRQKGNKNCDIRDRFLRRTLRVYGLTYP